MPSAILPKTSRKRYLLGIDEVGRAKSRQWRDRPLRQRMLAPSGRGSSKTIIGIDEVGRGALAGPVVVAGIVAKKPFGIKNRGLGPLKDSKKLTPRKREAWFRYFSSHPKISWAVSRVTPGVIDRINISRAANLASFRLVKKLTPGKRVFAYLDGGLALPEYIPHQAIIRGDEKMRIIAAASIMAKVTRDRAMRRLHKKDPRYSFDVHKGYGTKLHIQRIRKFGYSPFHRRSFVLKSGF